MVKKDIEYNESISSNTLRLIDENGEMLGIITKNEALAIADERGLDVVKISDGDPIVAKLCDINKHIYNTNKKIKLCKRNSKPVVLKELAIRVCTDTHDLQNKISKAREFLNDGHKVKFNMRFKRKEQTLFSDGIRKMQEIFTLLDCKYEQEPVQNGSSISMIVAPNSKKR